MHVYVYVLLLLHDYFYQLFFLLYSVLYVYAFPFSHVHVQHVCLGSRTELEVLKFAEDGFSFHWSKEGSRRQIKTTDDQPNTVSFPSVREEDFGHYQCEVKDAAAGKVLLTLYTALYKEDTSQLSNYFPL